MSTTATRIPTIKATTTPNFYDVLSSDGFTHYPLLVVGPGQVLCGCPAGEKSVCCYHYHYAKANLVYIDPAITLRLSQLEQDLKELNDTIWEAIQARADDNADYEAYQDMLEAA